MHLVPGTVIYIQQNDQYDVYQVLAYEANTYYLKSFWPVHVLPDVNKLNDLEIRAACTTLANFESITYVYLGEFLLNETDLYEIEQFKNIQTAKTLRQEAFSSGLLQAEKLLNEGQFQAVIEMLTTLAPYNKLELYTYELRGKAYLGLGQSLEASYDFKYILFQDSTRTDIKQILASIEIH